jgi:hypothetical protein
MPAKSKEAIARKKAKTAERNNKNKQIQQWWFVLSPQEENGIKVAKFTREEYYDTMQQFLCLAIAAESHASGLHKNKCYPDGNLDRVDTDDEEEENDENDETDDDSEESDDEFDGRSMKDFIADYCLDGDFKAPRTYYGVVCLEKPQDLNYMCKLYKPVSKATMLMVKDVMGELLFKTIPEMFTIEAVKSEWAVLRYLTWGYCDDGHKQFDHVDRTPYFDHGDVVFPTKHRNEIVQRTIEEYKFSHIADFREWCWFKHSNIRFMCNGPRIFNDAYRQYTESKPVTVGISTPESRLRKLRRYAEIDVVNPVHVQNIYDILEFHDVDADEFRMKVLRHLTHERTTMKRQLIIIGKPSSGKSRLSAGIDALLNSKGMPTTKSLKKFENLSKYASTVELDLITAYELQKSMGKGALDEDEMCAVYENTADLEDPYCELPPQLPILSNSQGMYYVGPSGRQIDFDSIKERLDVIDLKNGAMPEADRTVTGAAMSYFLFNPRSDGGEDEDEPPSPKRRRTCSDSESEPEPDYDAPIGKD